jgi:hypothetical protein
MRVTRRSTLQIPLRALLLSAGASGPAMVVGWAGRGAAGSVTRNPWDIPFSSSSVWNIGIGRDAKWGADGDPDVIQLRQQKGVVNAGSWGQPIYFGKLSDPLVTVRNTDRIFPLAPQRIHIPVQARPAAPAGGDAHMAFYDAAQPGRLWSYFGVAFDNGRDVTGGLTARLGGVWDTAADGVTNTTSPGSDYNFAVGTITSYDLAHGAIRHAVRVAIGRTALRSPGRTWTDGIPWPNTHEDYDGPKTYTGKITAGSSFGIRDTIRLEDLGLSQGGLMLAKALQDYGAIWRDSCGDGYFAFYSTPENEANSLVRQMRADLPKIMPHVSIMRNQGPASVNGGGQSRVAPLPPVDARLIPME